MYADRYGKTGLKPGALSVAIGLNGAVLAALIFSAPEIVKRVDPPFIGVNIPLPKDPPPLVDPVKPDIKPKTPIDKQVVQPPIERPTTTETTIPTKDFFPPSGPTGLEGGVTGGTGTVYDPPHVPVLVGAKVDPRYAGALQPAYPPSERRMGNEGKVIVRVLVGTDGRVKQIEQVGAASAALFAATRRQALDKWRFTPATRDGVPQEAWRTMTVTFVLNEDG